MRALNFSLIALLTSCIVMIGAIPVGDSDSAAAIQPPPVHEPPFRTPGRRRPCMSLIRLQLQRMEVLTWPKNLSLAV